MRSKPSTPRPEAPPSRLPRTLGLSALALLAVACAGEGPPVTRPVASAKPTARASAAPVAAVEPPCTPDKRAPRSGPAADGRQRGFALLEKADLEGAVTAFREALDADPADLAAYTLHEALELDLNDLHKKNADAYAQLKPVVLEALAPPQKAAKKADPAPATLSLKVDEPKVVPFDDWLAGLGLKPPIEDGVTPPSRFGERDFLSSFRLEGSGLARYGAGMLVIGDDKRGQRAVNLEPALQAVFKDKLTKLPNLAPESVSPELRWATVVGSKLIVQLAHEEAPPASADAVVAGFDLATDKALFVSDSEVGNSFSAYATATHLVTAFTGEKGGDIQLLDLETGRTLARVPIKHRVDHLVGKGTSVWAWSASATSQLELSVAPPVPALALGATRSPKAVKPSAPSVAQLCQLKNGALALDHRDGPALAAAAEALPQESSAAKAFQGAAEFLTARAAGAAGVDLTEKKPVPLSWVAGPLVGAEKLGTVKKRLVAVKESAANIPTLDPIEEDRLEGKRGQLRTVAQPTPLYSSVRLDFYPPAYGNFSVSGAFRFEDDVVINYGSRFLAVVRKSQLETLFDAKPLLGPSADAAVTATPLAFLTMLDGVLYAVISSASAYGQPGAATGYVAAIDRHSGKILWRTRDGVLTRPFIVFEDLLVTVEAGKRPALLLYRLKNGQELQALPLTDPPTDFGFDSRSGLFVAGAKGRSLFQLK